MLRVSRRSFGELYQFETEIVSVNDPLEKVNVVFQFNIIFDSLSKANCRYLQSHCSRICRNRVTYSLNNLGMPITAVNNVLQGELRKAGISTSRFIINSTVEYFCLTRQQVWVLYLKTKTWTNFECMGC